MTPCASGGQRHRVRCTPGGAAPQHPRAPRASLDTQPPLPPQVLRPTFTRATCAPHSLASPTPWPLPPLTHLPPAGLAAYFYTRDLRRAWTLAERLEYGMVRGRGGGWQQPAEARSVAPRLCPGPAGQPTANNLLPTNPQFTSLPPPNPRPPPSPDWRQRGGHHVRGGALWRREAVRPRAGAGHVRGGL